MPVGPHCWLVKAGLNALTIYTVRLILVYSVSHAFRLLGLWGRSEMSHLNLWGVSPASPLNSKVNRQESAKLANRHGQRNPAVDLDL